MARICPTGDHASSTTTIQISVGKKGHCAVVAWIKPMAAVVVFIKSMVGCAVVVEEREGKEIKRNHSKSFSFPHALVPTTN